MKLFAPRNDWNMTSPAPTNWWNMAGTYGTPSGIRIDESTAMTFSAVFAATRVISETLASLPCALLEQMDARTTARAISHPLWTILHDQPNKEQDVMSWLDSQVAFQVNWGNAYAEIQRDSIGNIVALWPIHPSRIPLKNIVRNSTDPRDYDGITDGKPGEIVYYVSNDDGTKSPIPASSMLHVPGVLTTNGITGQSIVKWGASSIGNAIAADMHAGSIFKNGAVTNMVLKSPKVVGPDVAERLRRQWQNMFGGVQNHYKTLLLEEGMEPVPINMNPEDTQLLATRQFSVTEIARWYRLPPHLLADLTQASYSNIESEGLSFIVYSMMPWIVRWEKAMQRQLLTPAEKKKYRFKFNVNGLLRGDQAARAQFYQTMFNLGAYSPNDIREKEDENPIEGGDQYFVQGNNAVPLDKIGELAQVQIDKSKAAPSPPPQQLPPPVQTNSQPDAHLADLRNQMVKMIADCERDLPETIVAAINTKSEAKANIALTKVRNALMLAVCGELEQLWKYESRMAREAAKKPGSFLTWRDEFYAKFQDKLATAIGVFVPAAMEIEIDIDAKAHAAAYVADSVATLELLADGPAKELERGVETVTDSWSTRPQRLAEAIFKKGAA